MKTRDTRIAIGFPPRESWRSAPAHYGPHTLTIHEHPVMEDWEETYMQELASIAASRGGTVLEVGFGMGISARYLQTEPIDTHIIIEANEGVYEVLTKFAERSEKITVPLFGFWEEVVSSIPSGSISGILFDTYPLSEDEIHQNHFSFFEEAFRMLAPQGVLTYYSDEVEDFSEKHRQALMAAGFTNIDKKVCAVDTPPDCAYWKSKTIMAPIIRK
jgi:guanidinoacetate N-methyltransferase